MSYDSIIDDLLDEYEDAVEGGEDVDIQALCAQHPDLVDEVRRRIAALNKMEQKLGGNFDSDSQPVDLNYSTAIAELEFLAKGGLGAVYVGDDQQLNRQVAIKFIHRDLIDDQVSSERFLLEAEVTGRLEHPGVIPMYGSGTSSDGRQFYAMRFIDGETLDSALRRYHSNAASGVRNRVVDFNGLLYSFSSVCKTIAYAHNRGIVHRDIKPDNVMLGRYGETIVVDWGLAVPVIRDERFKQSGEKTLMPVSGSSAGTSSGNGAGTPAYMSPEQASELAPTTASDIYSLGATLFKILTGRPPVAGDSLQEIRTKILEGRIPSPSSLNSKVERSLESICLKAMALQPSERYATAIELADDVERHLADEPVSACPETLTQRFKRFVRHQFAATIIAVAGLSGCLLLAGLTSFWLAAANHRERIARNTAEDARRENLSMSALFLAKSLANEFDLRLRILESEAGSAKLREFMGVANEQLLSGHPVDEGLQSELQLWLFDRFSDIDTSVKSKCLCIYGIEGTQVARAPRASSIGKNFRHRDYFHGEGHDLSPAELINRSQVRPLAGKDIYVSPVFQGSNTNTLMITFAVPIWSGPQEQADRQRIGLVAFPVELGEFSLGSHAVLADTRIDQIRKRAGLILHHPNLGTRSREDDLPYLKEPDLLYAKKLFSDRSAGDALSLNRSNLVESFYDPVDEAECMTAMEPVIIESRRNMMAEDSTGTLRSVGDTGWVVAVTEEH